MTGGGAPPPDTVWARRTMFLRRVGDAGGLTAAPVLAGFSFTLLALILPDLRPDAMVAPGAGLVAIRADEPFSASPEWAAILFVAAGALFVFALQTALMARQLGMTPAELMDWMAEEVQPRGATPEGAPDDGRRILHDREVMWEIRGIQQEMVRRERPWLSATKWLYNLGMLALLAGIVVMVWPPEPGDSPEQLAAALVALVALAAELTMVVALRIGAIRARRRAAGVCD